MSGCLQHLLLSFQFDQVFHDSSCIHSSPLLPTFEQKTPFSNPTTVLRIKCGTPWTCWEETDCGLHHPPLPSLCCFHLFSRTLLVPCQPQKAPVCSMSGIFAHNAFSWARLILLILDESTICSEGKWLSTPSSVQDLCPRSFLAITLPHFHLCRTRMSWNFFKLRTFFFLNPQLILTVIENSENVHILLLKYVILIIY